MEFEDLPIEIQKKIKNKQKYISINIDISNFGYRIGTKTPQRGSMKWINIEYYKEHYTDYNRKWKKEHKESVRQTLQKYREKNKEKLRKKATEYYYQHREEKRIKAKIYYENNREKEIQRRVEYGKLHRKEENKKIREWRKRNPLKAKAIEKRHKLKGFIPLTDLLEEAFDWHHIHTKLPFVVAVQRKTHEKYGGSSKKHCDLVNINSGWNIFVDDESDITSLEFVESVVEIKYPKQFEKYWFGDY